MDQSELRILSHDIISANQRPVFIVINNNVVPNLEPHFNPLKASFSAYQSMTQSNAIKSKYNPGHVIK